MGIKLRKLLALICLLTIVCPPAVLASVTSGGSAGSGSQGGLDIAVPVVYSIVAPATDSAVETIFANAQAEDPPGGCIFDFGAGTFDVDLEVPSCAVAVRGAGRDSSSLRLPTDSVADAVLLIEPQDGFRPGLVIYDITIDGNKQTRTIAPGRGNGIRISDTSTDVIANVSILNSRIHSTTAEAIYVADGTGFVARGNIVEYFGCHDKTQWNLYNVEGSTGIPDIADWTPNGIAASLMQCGTWGANHTFPDEVDDYQFGSIQDPTLLQPGRITNGIGIEVARNSDNADIDSNTVRYGTKLGMQFWATTEFDPDMAVLPDSGTMRSNTVSWVLEGIAAVRSTNPTIEYNLVEDIGAPWALPGSNVGSGIAVSQGGQNAIVRSNVVRRTEGAGYFAAAGAGLRLQGGASSGPWTANLTFTGNSADDTCGTYIDAGGFDFRVTQVDAADRADGLTLTTNTLTNNNCNYSVRVANRDDVDLSSGDNSFDAGTLGGLRARDVDNIDVAAGQFIGTSTGIGIDFDSSTSDCTITGTVGGTYTTPLDVDDCVNPTPGPETVVYLDPSSSNTGTDGSTIPLAFSTEDQVITYLNTRKTATNGTEVRILAGAVDRIGAGWNPGDFASDVVWVANDPLNPPDVDGLTISCPSLCDARQKFRNLNIELVTRLTRDPAIALFEYCQNCEVTDSKIHSSNYYQAAEAVRLFPVEDFTLARNEIYQTPHAVRFAGRNITIDANEIHEYSGTAIGVLPTVYNGEVNAAEFVTITGNHVHDQVRFRYPAAPFYEFYDIPQEIHSSGISIRGGDFLIEDNWIFDIEHVRIQLYTYDGGGSFSRWDLKNIVLRRNVIYVEQDGLQVFQSSASANGAVILENNTIIASNFLLDLSKSALPTGNFPYVGAGTIMRNNLLIANGAIFTEPEVDHTGAPWIYENNYATGNSNPGGVTRSSTNVYDTSLRTTAFTLGNFDPSTGLQSGGRLADFCKPVGDGGASGCDLTPILPALCNGGDDGNNGTTHVGAIPCN